MKAPLRSLYLGICMLWQCIPVFAQTIGSLCPNTALVPVFKQDFGQSVLSSTTTAAALGSTNYNFGGVSTDGNYIITPLVNNANKADWTKGGDHTGNTNGNMFLVNAGGGNSIFFQQTITGLCPGSSFNFSAWLANVNTPNTETVCGATLVYPKVTFNIKNLSGTVLGTVTTGSLPLSTNNGPPNWQQYGFQFSLPTGVTSLLLEMVDFYGGAAACGNDVALDDIIFTACTPQANVTLSSATSICSGSNTSITSALINSPFTTPTYQWQKSINNGISWQNIGTAGSSANSYLLNNVNVADGGMYKVLVGPDVASLSALTCITESNSIVLVVNPIPTLSLNTNTPICSDQSINIQSTVNGGTAPYTYSWTGPNGFTSTLSNPIIVNCSSVHSGLYFLNLIDSNGCSTNSNMYAIVNQTPKITIVNNAENICSSGISQIQFNSSLSGSSYNWNAKTITGTASGFVSNSVATSLNTINDVIVNTSSTTAIVSYVITTTASSGCSAKDSTEITIYPKPSIANSGADQILCNATTASLIANTPLIGNGTWNYLSGPSGVNFSDSTSPTSIVNGLIEGMYQFVWTIANNACIDTKDTVSINILAPLTMANAGPDQTLCNANTTSLNANSPASGNGTWTFLSGPSSVGFTNNLSPTSTVNGLIVGTYQFVWTMSNSICIDSKDTVSITVLAPLKIANAGPDQILCNANTTSLNANSQGSGNGTWSLLSGPSSVIFSNNMSPTSSVNGLIVGNYQFLWIISNSVCTDSKDTVSISVLAPLTIANAGPDQTLCNANATSLNANIPVSDNGTWSLLSGPSSVIFSNNMSPTSSVNGLIAGNYQFVWTIANSICIDSKDTVSITILAPLTIANAGADQFLCKENSTSLVANNPQSGNGTWTFLSGPSSIAFTNNTSPTAIVNGLTVGTYQFVWTIANNVCSDSKDTVTVTVLAPLTTANAGADQFLCNANSTSLEANSSQSGNGTWTFLSGPSSIVFSNSHSSSTIVNGIMVGKYQLIWTIANNVCIDSKDTVEIIVYDPIVNKIDTAQKIICLGQQITLSGETISGGNANYQYQWEQSMDGIYWKFIPGANKIQYTCTPDSSIFIRRQISSLPCFSYGNMIQIVVQESISDNRITGNQEICLGSPINKIIGSIPKGGIGVFIYQWEQSMDNGNTWSTIIAAASNDLMMKSVNQTTLFRRVVTTQNCSGLQASISNTVLVTVKKTPTISLQYKGGVYCSKNTPIDFRIQTTNTDSVSWDFGDGILQTFIAGNVSHQYTSSGNFIPKLIIQNSNKCIITYTGQDTITIDEIKPGFKLSAVYDCGKTHYRFIDTSQSYFTIINRNWLINQIPINAEKDFQKTFIQAGEYETELKLKSINGCTNTLDAKFNVSVYSYPKVNINAINQACLNNLLELKSEIHSIDSVAKFFWNLGNGTNATDSIVKVFYYSEGKYTVKLTVATINSCYDSAFKQLTIHPVPKIVLATNKTVCKGDSLELKAEGAVNYIWSDNTGTVICNNCTTVKVLPQKNMFYNVIGYSQFGCSEIGKTTVRLIQPFVINAKLADTICAGESKRIFVSGASYYNWSPDPGLSRYDIASPYANPSITTTYKVIGKDSYNCFTDSASIRMVVGHPTAIDLGRDSTIIAGTSVQFQVSSEIKNIKKYRWLGANFSCLNCPSPVAKIFLDQCVSCITTNIYGCNSTDTICIKTFCPSSEVFIPNAFSPDGDGINDKLIIQGRGIKMIKSFRVFSRWGEIVFAKENFLPGDSSSGWDGTVRGKAATPDIFVYICEVLCEKGLPATFKGNVAILK